MAYLPLSTANLPDPVINPAQGASPADYFGTVLYTAASSNGTYTHGDLNFRPDFTWIKNRNNVERHFLVDVVRGNTSVTDKFLVSNDTSAEGANGVSGTTFSVTDTGYEFVEASINTGELYFNSRTYVGWNWKANGSGVSNNVGSIPSTVSANTTSGFSICTYTGTGSATNFGHGLDQKPDMVIIKDRDSGSNFWVVGHTSLSFTSDNYLRLNATSAVEAGGGVAWNNTAPTPTTVSIGNSTVLNASGNDYIAYCFHSVEGFSKFGSYVGNGSADGPFVYTGFRPAFVMVKVASAAGERWQIHDTSREAYNGAIAAQFADGALVDNTTSTYAFDILSNGFKPRTSHEGSNYNGQTIIYMAFAEQPVKFSNAR